jgi:hypothetical protein
MFSYLTVCITQALHQILLVRSWKALELLYNCHTTALANRKHAATAAVAAVAAVAAAPTAATAVAIVAVLVAVVLQQIQQQSFRCSA